jgi:DNA-directed RNA polymerase subunit RPC12/RpoP
MSVHLVCAGSLEEPAEYESDNWGLCIVCGAEHDLDEGEDFRRIEGLPDGEGIICDDCILACSRCGEDVTESVSEFTTARSVREDVAWIDGKPVCFPPCVQDNQDDRR